MAKKTVKAAPKTKAAKETRPKTLTAGPYVIPRGKSGCELTVRFIIPRAKGCE